jgi:hypothetical protein
MKLKKLKVIVCREFASALNHFYWLHKTDEYPEENPRKTNTQWVHPESVLDFVKFPIQYNLEKNRQG